MIALTEEMREAFARALPDRAPVILAYVDPDGQPHITYRGSAQVHSDEQLAFWARNPEGGVVRAVPRNPKVAMLYRHPETRVGWQFYGRARIENDPEVRRAVFENSHEIERGLDPERKGVAIVVDVDRVVSRGEVVMERTTAG